MWFPWTAFTGGIRGVYAQNAVCTDITDNRRGTAFGEGEEIVVGRSDSPRFTVKPCVMLAPTLILGEGDAQSSKSREAAEDSGTRVQRFG
jgi:hypothetical protein